MILNPSQNEFRIEKIPWVKFKFPPKSTGAQTERSRNNFKIGPPSSMPHEIIEGFAYLKKQPTLIVIQVFYLLKSGTLYCNRMR
jgi:fumarate hydratase class II